MQRDSREQLEARLAKRWRKRRAMTIPSWWFTLAPSRGPRFWNFVEAMRVAALVQRDDRAGMGYLITQLNRRKT